MRSPAIGAVLLLGLAACAPAGGSGLDTGPVAGGTLTFAVDTEPPCLDPHVSSADITAVIQRSVFDSLVAQAPGGAFRPWLARSWTISPDGRTYTFMLRPGVRFQDGAPFDADSVKANFDHIVAKETRSQYAVDLLGPYVGTTVLGPLVAQVVLARPYSAFLQAVSTTYLGMESPKALRQKKDRLCAGADASVGTGPFRFTRWVRGQRAEFDRNPDYDWAPVTAAHPGPAYLARIVVLFLPESSVRMGALQSGAAEVVDAVAPVDVAALTSDHRFTVSRHDSPGVNYALYLNTRRAPFDDPRARVAIQRAVDMDQTVRAVYFGQYERAWNPLSPATPGYQPAGEHHWNPDPAEASRLLDELGYTGRDADGYRTEQGRRLTVRWPYNQSLVREQRDVLAVAVQDQLRKVGVDVELEPLDAGAYSARRDGGDYDIIGFSWERADPSVLDMVLASDQQFTDGGANGARLADPQIDAWLVGAGATADPAARDAAYTRVQQRAVDQAVVLPTYVHSRIMGLARTVHGPGFDTNAWPQLHDVWIEAVR
ncbi:ABC transporter substrate-binding protein [Kutzneria sp. 744]|uniref:ABC transporter substrate-binding protein n=1 Tax=Kutzneria sp. (strain 744) TaxID=345341 RepID=UPI0004B3CF71|nr:ABC transporter substrate-binding protein [Kutzneria sp. 744]